MRRWPGRCAGRKPRNGLTQRCRQAHFWPARFTSPTTTLSVDATGASAARGAPPPGSSRIRPRTPLRRAPIAAELARVALMKRRCWGFRCWCRPGQIATDLRVPSQSRRPVPVPPSHPLPFRWERAGVRADFSGLHPIKQRVPSQSRRPVPIPASVPGPSVPSRPRARIRLWQTSDLEPWTVQRGLDVGPACNSCALDPPAKPLVLRFFPRLLVLIPSTPTPVQ